MYRLEITTDDSERLIFTEELETWHDVKEEIDYFRSLEFYNIFLRVYKKNKYNELDYIGEFYNIQPITREQKKIKKLKLSTKIIIIEILLFPFMLLKEILKEY